MPKVSIIIPVYNVEKYLRQALDSVVNQTLKDIEIICIDDCSTDGSYEILQEYASKDDRIIVLKQETNQGVSIARNTGLEIAKGEYIMFLDSDDWLDITTCQKTYEKIIQNNIDMMCFGVYNFRNGTITPREDIKFINRYKENIDLPVEALKHLVQNACAKLIKRTFIVGNNIKFPSNIITCEDGIFCLLCIYKEPKISLLDECLYYYRRGRKGSACLNRKNIVKTDILAFQYILSNEDFNSLKNCSMYKKRQI